MSTVLDAIPEAAQLVGADLTRRGDKVIDTSKGREGMTAEQVLRAFVVKQMNGYSYEELAFHLADSNTYRSFCRFGIAEKPPTKSRLQKNIKRVSAETWAAINRKLVLHAAVNRVETGRKVRIDCTVVESNIHAPTDSSLLWDCVRVLARLQREARDDFGLSFNDHQSSREAARVGDPQQSEQRATTRAVPRPAPRDQQDGEERRAHRERTRSRGADQHRRLAASWSPRPGAPPLHRAGQARHVPDPASRAARGVGPRRREARLDLRAAHGHHREGSARDAVRPQDLPDRRRVGPRDRRRDRRRQPRRRRRSRSR